jgi:hypothetical protein
MGGPWYAFSQVTRLDHRLYMRPRIDFKSCFFGVDTNNVSLVRKNGPPEAVDRRRPPPTAVGPPGEHFRS